MFSGNGKINRQAQVDDLSAEEQIEIVASEVAADNGGVMADIEMLTSASAGSYSSLAKSTSFDTSITKAWLTYNLSLSFYKDNGEEQNSCVPGLTDKLPAAKKCINLTNQ